MLQVGSCGAQVECLSPQVRLPVTENMHASVFSAAHELLEPLSSLPVAGPQAGYSCVAEDLAEERPATPIPKLRSAKHGKDSRSCQPPNRPPGGAKETKFLLRELTPLPRGVLNRGHHGCREGICRLDCCCHSAILHFVFDLYRLGYCKCCWGRSLGICHTMQHCVSAAHVLPACLS